jgi:hypothetical protein
LEIVFAPLFEKVEKVEKVVFAILFSKVYIYMNKYNMYITFIIGLKVIFIFLASGHLYLQIQGKKDTQLDKNIVYWEKKVEFVFITFIACLLIYLFSPNTNRNILIDHETKLLLFLFGFMLLITANWEEFFKESAIFKEFQSVV